MTALLELWPELATVEPPARRKFRHELRRIPGPVFKPGGPRGAFRPHVLRCGLCQGWASYARADLRSWTWTPVDGLVHRRCAKYRAARGGDARFGRSESVGLLEVKRGRARPSSAPGPSSISDELELHGGSRERRRRRGRARRGRELAPWDGPPVLSTSWGDLLAVIGASTQGLAVLVAPLPELRGRVIRSGGHELSIRYVHQDAPSWRQLRELRPGS